MDNRSRKNQLKIYLNDEELELFKRKMKLAKCKSMAHFIRKCVMEKEIYHVDLEPFREIQWLLSNATNNINQIAKHVNQTGIIYKDDIKSIRQDVDRLSKEIWQIHSLLLNRTTEGDD
ncbi:plasmid mobilization protein [Gallicola sp. Sow4_E12]|uniref:plasmid mobilization protein n=1 Tax=Gallicola sp. Sow4_E12 TaxID=3438785 RepID=UPI003F91793E